MRSEQSWVPKTKVMASGLGGTIAGLVIDLIQVRGGVELTDGEMTAIIVFSGLIAAYFIPEREEKNALP